MPPSVSSSCSIASTSTCHRAMVTPARRPNALPTNASPCGSSSRAFASAAPTPSSSRSRRWCTTSRRPRSPPRATCRRRTSKVSPLASYCATPATWATFGTVRMPAEPRSAFGARCSTVRTSFRSGWCGTRNGRPPIRCTRC
uniref:(northern house mosquito) hypothetical protein n=3 Tax=Culex pipiens TaxID=7175 RepID=A0A8D8CJQ9_CULPI